MKICGLGLPTYITKIDPPQNLMIPQKLLLKKGVDGLVMKIGRREPEFILIK